MPKKQTEIKFSQDLKDKVQEVLDMYDSLMADLPHREPHLLHRRSHVINYRGKYSGASYFITIISEPSSPMSTLNKPTDPIDNIYRGIGGDQKWFPESKTSKKRKVK